MEFLFPVLPIYSASAVSALFSAVWEGLILAACVAVCLRLFPSLSAAARSVIWLNVFLLVALLPLLPSLHILSLAERSGLPGTAAIPAPIELDLRWSLAIAALWCMLSLGRAIQLMVSAVRLRGLVRRSTPIVPDPALKPLLQTQVGSSIARRSALLCTSAEVERPSVFGFFRPRILLPPALLDELSTSELEQVVIHEMEHLRRGDDWTNLLQKVCLVLFPVNPVLLWVERRLCAERELACDDSVLRSSCGRKAYALCLTHLAEHSMLRRSFSLVLGAWERQSELVRRVHRILSRPSQSMSARHAKLVTASLLIAALGGAAALARTPQLVSFAPLAQPTMQASSIAPGRFTNSSLNQSGIQTPSVQLVKAVMPWGLGQPVNDKKPLPIKAAKRVARPRLTEALQTLESQQTFVVLTEWTDNGIPPHVVFAVDHNRIRYAAVPVANGWLIVQI
ncbi:MAG: M56 family metallopeptidase [Terracidiphilus sp.]|jgi:beta-lactamase regulating signal transducer with metallopeptidase domain